MKANISRGNNFLLLTPTEWLWIADEIIKDYPTLTVEKLEIIIANGVKGKYNKFQPAINSFTIFGWIHKYFQAPGRTVTYNPMA